MLVLLQVSHEDPLFTLPAVVLGVVVFALAAVLAGIAWRASKRRANPGLRVVAFAFALFSLKGLFTAINVQTHWIPHDAIELVLSGFDLALLALLFVPFLARRRAG